MKWDKLLSKGFVLFFIVFLIIAAAALSTPLWIPKLAKTNMPVSLLGDAIGGITSPFITLVMAILAFLAFWMQFQALRDQRREMNRQHFEDRLSLMLTQQRENTNSLKAGKIVGRGAAEELAGEFYFVLTAVTSIFKGTIADDIKGEKSLDEPERAKLTLYYDKIHNDNHEAMKFLMKTAYGIFFQGKNFTPNVSDEKECLRLTQLIEARLNPEQYTIDGNTHYADILFQETKDLSTIQGVPYVPFQGHNAEMGCYYRHLYQIVRFIACHSEMEMPEEEKYAYTKLVRSHLSDYEQFLLYYNSFSDFGASWNRPLIEEEVYKPKTMGMIARFRLVKNLPGNICWRGICPIDRYKNEINDWKKLNSDFFETPQFLTIDLLN